MSHNPLPDGFHELGRFVEKWDQPGTNARYAERLASDYAELEDFHAVFGLRVADIKAYLDTKEMSDFTEQDRALARLTFAWVPVAEAVEVFKQPRVPDSKTYWDIQNEPEL